MTAEMMKKKLEGWFATSFWVDVHYALATLGTLALIIAFVVDRKFDSGFAAFVSGMWVTAVGNDKINMPAVGGGQ